MLNERVNEAKAKKNYTFGICVCVSVCVCMGCGLFGIAGLKRVPEGQELEQGIISRATAERERQAR